VTLDLSAFLATHNPELIHLRRHLHAHPELGKAERQTTALVARRLEAVGLRPRLLSTGTGLICDIGDGDGPTIALRADLDALPLQDEKDVPYRSTVPGVCHACGHDVHTTILLGAGLALAQHADRLPGRVRLVFQPAEECLGGSIDVIADRVLEGVSAIYALHCDPKLEVGRLGVRVGAITAASDQVEVHLSGPGGHTARPHLTADLVYVIGRVVTDLPAALSRLVDTRAALNITFGAIESGTIHNAIPTSAVAKGTLRVLDRAVWGEAQKLVERVLEATVAPFSQVTYRLDYQRGAPPVVNDEEATAVLATAARTAIGDEAVLNAPQSMGGEDFSWYLEEIPGSMARLGVRIPGSDLDIHAASFDVDERAIAVGVRILIQTVFDALQHYRA
jgi:amidohydrolase